MQRFDPQATFVVSRYNFQLNNRFYDFGEEFDKDSISVRRLRQLFDARRIKIDDTKPLTNEEDDAIIPEIVKAGPAWHKVLLDGKQIGKTVRTIEEAQGIVEAYQNGELS